MHFEVQSAATLITTLAQGLDTQQKELFHNHLCTSMYVYYTGHWFPEKPNKGSAYRCIQISPNFSDQVIKSSVKQCNFSNDQLTNLFKSVFTIWVDPGEVSYRIGEEGSIGIYFKDQQPQQIPQQSNNLHQSNGFQSPVSSLLTIPQFCHDPSSTDFLIQNLQNIIVNV